MCTTFRIGLSPDAPLPRIGSCIQDPNTQAESTLGCIPCIGHLRPGLPPMISHATSSVTSRFRRGSGGSAAQYLRTFPSQPEVTSTYFEVTKGARDLYHVFLTQKVTQEVDEIWLRQRDNVVARQAPSLHVSPGVSWEFSQKKNAAIRYLPLPGAPHIILKEVGNIDPAEMR